MVRSRIDESVAGQAALGIHKRQPDDWPRGDVPLWKCRIGRNFYVTVCKRIEGHKCLEQ